MKTTTMRQLRGRVACRLEVVPGHPERHCRAQKAKPPPILGPIGKVVFGKGVAAKPTEPT